jgi:hypothetical protein
MNRLRVINLSLPKSGTTTLAVALRQAGLSVADWRIRRGQGSDAALRGKLIAPMIYEDYFATGDPLARLDAFDAITEMSAVNADVCYWPQTDAALLDAIGTHHPGVKFLLARRDPGKVAKSMQGWNNLGSVRLPRNDVPGLPRPFGGEVSELTRWIEGHYRFCDRMFRGADNFLAYDLEEDDVRARIATFLGIELPWWGEANTSAERADRAAARRRTG